MISLTKFLQQNRYHNFFNSFREINLQFLTVSFWRLDLRWSILDSNDVRYKFQRRQSSLQSKFQYFSPLEAKSTQKSLDFLHRWAFSSEFSAFVMKNISVLKFEGANCWVWNELRNLRHKKFSKSRFCPHNCLQTTKIEILMSNYNKKLKLKLSKPWNNLELSPI